MLLLTLALALPTLAVSRSVWVDRRLISCNDDWASKGSNLLELLRHDPDFIFIQEGKRAHYVTLRDSKTGTRLLDLNKYGVVQDWSSPAKAGSVVIYKRPSGKYGKHGFTFAVRARGLLPRYIAWVRASIGSTKVFLFAAHRPPVRVKAFWHRFDVALYVRLAHAHAAGRIILGGMDSNEHGGPPHPKWVKWVAVSGSIDGFIMSRDVHVVSGPRVLAKNTSDHHPVMCTVRIAA